MKRSAFKPVRSADWQAKEKVRKPPITYIKSRSKVSKGHPRGAQRARDEKDQWSQTFDPEGKRGRVLETKAANQLEIGNEEEHSSGHRDKRISESHTSSR